MRKQIFWLCNLLILWGAGTNTVIASPENGDRQEWQRNRDSKTEIGEYRVTVTPLAEQLFTYPSAKQLNQGDVIINFDSRLFFLPDLIEGNNIDNSDTAINFNTGFSWGITDKLQLTLQFQHVDSSSPAKQGDFAAERSEDNEAAIEVKQRLWQNDAGTQSLSGVAAASWGTRGFIFTGQGEIIETNNRDIFISLAVPFTADVGDRWQFNFAPNIAFFKDDGAGFFRRLPNDDDSAFGTTFGFSGGVAYEVNSQLFIFGDTFIPLTGNNSINRDSGKPDKAIAYNAGLRYLVNPRLALDLFATNTFASFAPLSLTADRDLAAIGTKLVFMPDFISGNRKYGDSFTQNRVDNTPLTTDGLAFFDGGTLPSGKFLLNLQGGNQGFLTALRYGLLKDLEAGIYLDYIAGEVDESKQGISGKVRLLNQAENDPVTLSLAATVGLTNQPFANFIANDIEAFDRQGLSKEVPLFFPGGDDAEQAKETIVTLSLPTHYELNKTTAIWLTPTVGYVQREGAEIAGFNAGGSINLNSEFSFLAEAAVNFAGRGNAFIGNTLADRLPWTIALRWTPLSLLNREAAEDNSDPQLELYFTNRVGFSTWHQFRVREDNDLAIGVGLQLPF